MTMDDSIHSASACFQRGIWRCMSLAAGTVRMYAGLKDMYCVFCFWYYHLLLLRPYYYFLLCLLPLDCQQTKHWLQQFRLRKTNSSWTTKRKTQNLNIYSRFLRQNLTNQRCCAIFSLLYSFSLQYPFIIMVCSLLYSYIILQFKIPFPEQYSQGCYSVFHNAASASTLAHCTLLHHFN